MIPNTKISLNGRDITLKSPCFVIAEAGVNHNGDMEVAKKLVDLASEAGAQAVKFQNFIAKNLIIDNVKKARYQLATTNSDETQGEMLKRLEISKEQTALLKEYTERKKMLFLSTPFDFESLQTLENLKVKAYKIASTDTTNLHFLREIARTQKPIFFSTGMSHFDEVRKAVDTILEINPNLIVMQCTANYPINDEEANLRVIDRYINEFGTIVGFSDHTTGVGAAPYAVAKGATVLEKHFTLDKNSDGPDHLASLAPDELKKCIKDIRKCEAYLGSTLKIPTINEIETRKSLQKSIVAKHKIKTGEKLSKDNLALKRTSGTGIPAIYFDDVIGKEASADFNQDDIITL